jgi:predicted AlkP superfamily pyrophosphatase or phosphodiesterase
MQKWYVRLVAVLGILAAIVLPSLFALSSPQPADESGGPRLAVLVYIDQFRGDFPGRWDSLFSDDGFRRLEREGTWFQNCHYDYANTVTGAGHATVATGCTPDVHGIIGNEWYDRAARAQVSCVESERYRRVPPAPRDTSDGGRKPRKAEGVAPDRLRAPTVADALKKATGGRARVVSLSLKDRSAVLPAGQHPDACYWFDPADGAFVTSTYYRDRAHPWAATFNRSRRVDHWFGHDWTRLQPGLNYELYSGPDDAPGEGKGVNQGRMFPHPLDDGPKKLRKDYYGALYNSPFGNDLLLELAGRAIDGEKLGRRDVPDLLCISFSSNDAVGHTWGPDSQEVLDVTLRTDLILRDLLTMLDAKVGRGRYVLALTADHGVCPLPEAAKARGHDAGRVPTTLLKSRANEFLVEKFGGDTRTRYVADGVHPWIYLNYALLKSRGLKVSEVADALVGWLKKQPGIQAAYTNTQLVHGVNPEDAIGRLMQRSFDPQRCGDVGVVMKPYWILWTTLTGTTHGSPEPYDTHVPLMVYGPGIKTGSRTDLVRPDATAAILARALGIGPPAMAVQPVPDELFETAAPVRE